MHHGVLSFTLLFLLLFLCACTGGETATPLLINEASPAAPQATPVTLSLTPLVADTQVGQTLTVDVSAAVQSDADWQLIRADAKDNLSQVLTTQEKGFSIKATATGLSQVEFQVSAAGMASSAMLYVAISAPDNQAPVAANKALTTDSNTPVSVDLASLISDPESDSLSIQSLLQTAERFSLDGFVLTFTPAGFVGTDAASYVVQDARGALAVAQVVVSSSDATVQISNTAPTAKDYQLAMDSADVLTIDLAALGLIADADGDSLSLSLYGGNARAAVDGLSIRYTPAGFVGTEELVYVVSDNQGGSAIATVIIDVSSSDSLTLQTVSTEVQAGAYLTLDISSAVTCTASWTLVQVADSPLLTIEAINDTSVTLNALSEGLAIVEYSVRAGHLLAKEKMVVAISAPDNQAPVAANKALTTDSNTPVSVDLASLISDPESDSLSIQSLLQTAERFSLDGFVLTFTPAGFVGTDAASYVVQDARGALAVAQVVVSSSDATVQISNTAPTAKDYQLAMDSADVLTIDLAALGLIADADGDSLSLSLYGGNARAAVDGLSIRYTPAGFVGTEELVYVISDNQGGSAIATIRLLVSDNTPANTPPLAGDLNLSFSLAQVLASASQAIDISAIVGDADGDELTLSSLYGSLNTALISSALAIDYQASADTANDSLVYVISDGRGGLAQGTINIAISNTAPTAQAISASVDPYAGGSVGIDLSLYTSDSDGDTLTLSHLDSPTTPSTISASGLVLTFTPNGYVGTQSLRYEVNDGQKSATNLLTLVSASTASLSANDINLAAIAMDAGQQSIDVSAYVSNSSGRSMRLVSVSGAGLGTTALSASPLTFYYTPSDISYGDETLTYRITDDEGHFAEANISLTLDPPADALISSLTLSYAGTVTATLSCSDCDHPTNSSYQFEVDGLPVSGSNNSYSPQGDDKDKRIGVIATVRNRYCNADNTGVNGGNACRFERGQTIIETAYPSSVTSSLRAHATLKSDGTVLCWGNSANGGDCSVIQSDLVDVASIAHTDWAFAALKNDGTVEVWGNTLYGGDNSAGAKALRVDVAQIYGNEVAFAAVKNDGTVVTWGNVGDGGNSASVQSSLTDVEHITASARAFAALKGDASVISWGNALYGGDSSAVSASLVSVKQTQATLFAFAALKYDGTVVAWGDATNGGDASAVQAQLINVAAIYPNWRAFAAVKADGSVVTWGNSLYGGDSSSVSAQLTNVVSIAHTTHAYAALKADATVVTWGAASIGGNSSAVQAQLINVASIASTQGAFAAIKDDGSVVTWGSAAAGGDSSAVQAELTNVVSIIGNEGAFAALKADGSVVTWGNAVDGGDSSSVAGQLVEVEKLYANSRSFVALKEDGSLISWGDATRGGDSSAIQSQTLSATTVYTELAMP